jgi:hypothetical protein
MPFRAGGKGQENIPRLKEKATFQKRGFYILAIT